jgi:L-fucose isomerase-like protein
MSARFGYVTVSSQSSAGLAADASLSDYTRALESLGGEPWEYGDTADPAPMLILVATGGSERTILELWRRRSETSTRFPSLMIAHPGSNSLPAALEALARLRQDGQKGRILYVDGPGDTHGFEKVDEAVRDVEVHGALRRARIGVFGSPSGWLVASSPDPAVVRRTWGPQVVHIGMEELTETIRGAVGSMAESLGGSLVDGAAQIVEPGSGEIDAAVRVSTAVRQLAERHGMRGVALRCFDLIEELGTTGCVALSEISDGGLAAGCEGDVVSAVGALWVRLLLDQPSWVANPARVRPEENKVILAHCTVPRSMVDGYTLRSHYESGSGVAIQGRIPEGPATVFRIGGREMKCLWIAEGEIIGASSDGDMCRTQVEVRLTDGGTAADLLTRPLGNHVLLVRGRYADRLTAWWEMLIGD